MSMPGSERRRHTPPRPHLPPPVYQWSATATGAVTDSFQVLSQDANHPGLNGWLRSTIARAAANPDTDLTITVTRHRRLSE